jgi:hypothetical protein
VRPTTRIINHSILSVLDEGYYSNVLDEGLTRDVVCALNVISTFSLLYILFTESDLGDGLGLMNGYSVIETLTTGRMIPSGTNNPPAEVSTQ